MGFRHAGHCWAPRTMLPPRLGATVVELEHKERGRYLTVGSPIKFSDFAPAITASPLLGEHTDEVLAELGYDANQIAAMHAKGAVRSAETKEQPAPGRQLAA